MTTTHVYQIYIRASIETVWGALLDPAFTRAYFHDTAFTEPPVEGQPYVTTTSEGHPAVDGTIEVIDPPHRLAYTWHTLYDPEMAAEPASRVEWVLTEAGPGLTRLRLTHGDLAFSPLTWARVKDGWVWIVDSLKSLLETGTALPPAVEESATSAGGDAASQAAGVAKDWHRMQGIEANNATWDLLDAIKAGTAPAAGVVRSAYAAAYHWERARGATPANEARARYLIGKAWLAYGRPELGLEYGDRTLAQCTEHGLVDFDLAYAHELRARALGALGRSDEAAEAWRTAKAVPVADPEDLAIVEADFADAPV